jgi:GxxExxY protein
MQYRHQDVTQQIVDAFYAVYNSLGYGFLERVYENSMAIQLRARGLKAQQQASIQVYYRGEVVGEYFADLLIEDKIIVELKAVASLLPIHEAQLLNYLKATPFEVGLLLNFGPSATKKRKIFDNARKPNLKG